MIHFVKHQKPVSAMERAIKGNPAMQFARQARAAGQSTMRDQSSPTAQGAGLGQKGLKNFDRAASERVIRQLRLKRMMRFLTMRKGGAF